MSVTFPLAPVGQFPMTGDRSMVSTPDMLRIIQNVERKLRASEETVTALRDALSVEQTKAQTLREELNRAELELGIMRSVFESLRAETKEIAQKVAQIEGNVRAQVALPADLAHVAETFKILYGNGSDDVRIEYLDGRLPLLTVSGVSFFSWTSEATPRRYIQFTDETRSRRIQLPLFFWGKDGDVSTFVDDFHGDVSFDKRMEVLANDDLWLAGQTVSLQQTNPN